MNTNNVDKPEIGYDCEAMCFTQYNDQTRKHEPITDDQVCDRWNAADSDWTAGAFRRMAERVMT